MTPGLALIIGVLIGAAAVYFVMQAKAQKRERALQQTRARLAQSEQEQEHRLREVAHQIEADYEKQISEKIEQYQDEYEQHLEDLEAEYEARLAALGVFSESVESSDADKESQANLEDNSDNPDNTPLSSQQPTSVQEDNPGVALATTAGIGTATTAPAIIPDPWDEQGNEAPPETTESSSITEAPSDDSPDKPVSSPEELETGHESAAPETSPSEAAPTTSSKQHQDIEAIQSLLTHNRRALTKALPSLTKLSKDPDPTVRLAVINTLKQVGSIKAIPLLRQALRDSDSKVVAAANEALVRFKGMKSSPRKPPSKKLPKNR